MSGPVPGPPRPGPAVPRPGPPPVPPALQAAQDRLATVQDRPLEEQVAVYDEVHRLLQDALAALDDPSA